MSASYNKTNFILAYIIFVLARKQINVKNYITNCWTFYVCGINQFLCNGFMMNNNFMKKNTECRYNKHK